MSNQWGSLLVDVVDDEILVSLPGTSYIVVYFKREGSPQLSARHIPMADDLRTPVKLSEFLHRAWSAVTTKLVSLVGLPRAVAPVSVTHHRTDAN
jgi:hypothetical protein